MIKLKHVNKRGLVDYVYLDSSLLKKMVGPSKNPRVLASKTPLSSLFRVSCNRMVDWLGSLQAEQVHFPCKTPLLRGTPKKGDELKDRQDRGIRFISGQALCLNSRMRGSAGAACGGLMTPEGISLSIKLTIRNPYPRIKLRVS